MALGFRLDNPDGTQDGVALMYTNPNFYNWTLTDTIIDKVAGIGMWECLNIYLSNFDAEAGANHSVLRSAYWKNVSPESLEHYREGFKYVLKASMDELRHDHYAIGTYSLETHQFEADNKSIDIGIGYRYDWGKFYALKPFYDPSTSRRILWGYVNESDSLNDDVSKAWASVMVVHRTIWLDPMTQSNLLIWPVEEMNLLRSTHNNHHNIVLNPKETWKVKGGKGNQLDVMVIFERPNVSDANMLPGPEFDYSRRATADRGVYGPFGVLVLAVEKLSEYTGVFFYIYRK